MQIRKNSFIFHKNTDLIQRGVYLDIETTGLSRQNSILYMIGCGIFDGNIFSAIQWFNDDAVSEEMILNAFISYLSDYIKSCDNLPRHIYSFNGDQFDLPFLKAHCKYNEIEDAVLDQFISIDLYRSLSPCKSAFGLSSAKQKDWESLIALHREDKFSGRDLIKIYKSYLKNPSTESEDLLYLHNIEDIKGLVEISPLLIYAHFKDFNLQIQEISADSSEAFMSVICSSDHEFPLECVLSGPVSDSVAAYSIHICKEQIIFKLPYYEGELKYFYKDYKNYYYLPDEDRAVHKSLGMFVDPEHRKQAHASDCFIKTPGVYFQMPALKARYSNLTKDFKYTSFKEDYHSVHDYIEMEELFAKSADSLSFQRLEKFLYIIYYSFLR